MNTYTTTTNFITNTTATIAHNKTVEYFNNPRKGLTNNYSVLGLIVSIETTRQRGWTAYNSEIRVAYKNHVGTPDGFSEWYNAYKTSFGATTHKSLHLAYQSVERATPTRLQEAHDVAVLAGELHVLTIINKYVELLFNSVDKEVINRQINELQSQLATLA